jgi:hypothetical protein
MTYNAKVLKIIEKLKFFVNALSTKEQFRKCDSDFSRQKGTRQTGLDFTSYCLLGISLLKNSLSVELCNLLKYNDLTPINKSSYSEGRYKILPEFYWAAFRQDWNNLLLALIYEQVGKQEIAESVPTPLKTLHKLKRVKR